MEENNYLYGWMVRNGCTSAYFGAQDQNLNNIWTDAEGNPISFFNWAEGEPNRIDGAEKYAMFYDIYPDGTWNDGDFGDVTEGGYKTFICEWGEKQNTCVVPVFTNVYNSVKGGDIRWKAVPNCLGYAVYRQRAAEGIQKIAVIDDPGITQCFDPGIRDNCYGRVYHYYITALYKDAAGNTIESKPSEKLVLQRLAPMKITNKVQSSNTSVSLTWACTVNENKAYGYELQYAESSRDLYDRKGTFAAIPVEGRSSLSAAVKNLENGKQYWFRVRCYVNYTHSVTGALTKTWSQYSNVVNLKLVLISNNIPS